MTLLTLKRRWFTEESTIGDLYIDGVRECFTLEDCVREKPDVPVTEWKIPGKTAIPYGSYDVIIDMSNRFKRRMPHILSVPGFDGVRIHILNIATETEGCVGVGQGRTIDKVFHSKLAFDAFFAKLDAALETGQVRISVEDGRNDGEAKQAGVEDAA